MERHGSFVLQGNIIYTPDKDHFITLKNGYIVVEEGRISAICATKPAAAAALPLKDCRGKLIMPGFADLHLHAPQYIQIGMGMDDQLLDWLNRYTFKEEPKFADPDYARQIYPLLAEELADCGTTSASIFATIHPESTDILCDILAQKGLRTYVGKVNMDNNSAPALTEDTAQSLSDTEAFIKKWHKHPLVKPIITPRFVPSVTAGMMTGLGKLVREYNVPVQSHLSENKGEIQLVKELFPEDQYYMSVYDRFDLFGTTPTLMAHCIHLSEEEIAIMARKDVYAVHCPASNLNLASGLMPLRRMLDAGVKVVLGSDIGGGHTLFIPHEIVRAIEISKIRSIDHPEEAPLKLCEAFYLATKAGGSFFGQTGSLEPDYSADFLVVTLPIFQQDRTIEEQLQYFIYHGRAQDIEDVYVQGRPVKHTDKPAV
ncbi:guanine deaminase [Selenomonas ruminantium]|uniref:Guanine deaminase n=1 Tax=Selenomonas ruminantium TaxID=971 RepID=A0A1M6TBF6_SELRU|nr:guanine deaminase [Selenomonas ruminantium]SHK54209.1 guanine deaminase [Selenomonas ruminantium]